jgi:hypothetical protein
MVLILDALIESIPVKILTMISSYHDTDVLIRKTVEKPVPPYLNV